MVYQSQLSKFKKLRQSQLDKDNKLPNPEVATDAKKESLHDIISELREEYFSDLNPDDIPNSEISDISDSELRAGETNINDLEKNQDIDSKI